MPDAGPDVVVVDVTVPEAEADVVSEDATEEDVVDEDVLPPIDVSPPVDVANDCPDAGSTLVYVITYQNALMSFYPPTGTFKRIGTITCPTVPANTPYSMAVDRLGIAYVVFSDGELFRVSTADASGQATSFATTHPNFTPNVRDGLLQQRGRRRGDAVRRR